VHEHRERVGMLFPYSIWSKTGRRVVLDGGVDVGFLPTAMAAGVLQARAMEGCEGGAGSLQGDDVVLLVPLVGVDRPCTGGSTESRVATEEGARRRRGPAIPVEELEIGLLGELRWVVRVLFVLRIGGEERRWGLPTVSRSRGRCPVKCGGWSRRI
jgi:hypothetical protein